MTAPLARTLLSAASAPVLVPAVVAVSALLNLLPKTWFMALCAGLGDLLRALGARRAVVEDNVAKAFPEWDGRRRRRLVKEHYRSLGFVALDMARMLTLTRAQLAKRASLAPGSRERIRDALAGGGGAALAGSHTSNWELAAALLGTEFPSVRVVAKVQTNPLSQWLISLHRRRFNLKPIYPGKAFQKMPQVLKDNALLIFVLDQHYPGKSGAAVDFFGRPARTSTSLAKIARITGAAVLPSACRHDKDGLLEITAAEPLAPPGALGDPREEDVRGAQACSHALERLIRRHPEQWLWCHRRWRDPTP